MLALPIGWDRERHERSAGLRTFPLVAVASCGFVQATESMAGASPEAQARIIEGLITGIGFIGGGAILKLAEAREIEGLTTAAGIWMTAAVGVAVGLGRLWTAVLSMVLGWIILRVVGALEFQRDHRSAAPGGDRQP